MSKKHLISLCADVLYWTASTQ